MIGMPKDLQNSILQLQCHMFSMHNRGFNLSFFDSYDENWPKMTTFRLDLKEEFNKKDVYFTLSFLIC